MQLISYKEFISAPVLNLPDFTIKSVKKDYPLIIFEVCYKGKKQCAHCQSFEVRIKSSFIRQVRYYGIGDKSSLLNFKHISFIVVVVSVTPINALVVFALIRDQPSYCRNNYFITNALRVYRLIAPDIKFQRALMTVLIKPIAQLTEKQQQRQPSLFNAYPVLEIIYDFECKLHQLLMLKTCKAKRAKKPLPKFLSMVELLKDSPF